MAINAYVGLQGSGKSFEVVSSVILDELEQGRRVVTNVAGINEDRIHEYLVSKRKADADTLGQIVHVTNDRILQPQFFPDEEKPELESVVQGGDLVAIDEAWRFWGVDNGKLSHEHMQFFRMHRHYVNPKNGTTCDVVLMTQDITGLHRSVRNVIEFTFRMCKLKSLGLSKRYRVEIYEGWKLSSKTRIDDRQKKYNPDIFPLYQSYTGGMGMEKAIDKRQNILANSTLWTYVAATVVSTSIAGWGAWRFFHPKEAVEQPEVSKQNKSGSATAAAAPVVPPAIELTFSEAWRVVGRFETEEARWVIVADESGRLRMESPSMFNGEGAAMVGHVDGEAVAYWSGSSARQVAGAGK